jgi:hypothetical protein
MRNVVVTTGDGVSASQFADDLCARGKETRLGIGVLACAAMAEESKNIATAQMDKTA